MGDFDFSRTDFKQELIQLNGDTDGFSDDSSYAEQKQKNANNHETVEDTSVSHSVVFTKDYISSYKPRVANREWLLSETDLEFLTIGCYILGTGGGGNPYQHFLRLREMLRAGTTLRVISPWDLKDDAIVACGGAKGSPQVSIEKPYGCEIIESQEELYRYLNTKPDAVIPLEIGGGNGLQGLIIGASTNLNIPAIDGDWMGRAYPVSWQTTPVVFEKKAQMIPTCISDGNGRIILMTKAHTELDAERALRAALSQMGSHVGCAKGPVSGANTKKWVVENTMSLSWRIGRAVALSRCTNTIDTVAESIIDEVGGAESAKVLFKGKIVGVERVTRMGHAYGEVVIESTEENDDARMVIPFKNENIFAKKIYGDGREEVSQLPSIHPIVVSEPTNTPIRFSPLSQTSSASWIRRMEKRSGRRSIAMAYWLWSLVLQRLRSGRQRREGLRLGDLRDLGSTIWSTSRLGSLRSRGVLLMSSM